MTNRPFLMIASGLATALMLSGSPPDARAEGFGPMNMMNPGSWFRGRRDLGDDYYYAPNGYYPPPAPYGVPAGYAPPPAAAAPPPPDATAQLDEQRIQRLEARIRQLEEENAAMRRGSHLTTGAEVSPNQGLPAQQPRPAGPRTTQIDPSQPQNLTWRPD